MKSHPDNDKQSVVLFQFVRKLGEHMPGSRSTFIIACDDIAERLDSDTSLHIALTRRVIQ